MKFTQNFRNLSSNLLEIFTTFHNSYELHSQNFYILHKKLINNYYIYKNYPAISTDQNCPKVYTYDRRKIWVRGADKNCFITYLLVYFKKTTSTLLPDSEFANGKIDSLQCWMLQKLPIISKNVLNKSCPELNFMQKSQWTGICISHRSGARVLQRYLHQRSTKKPPQQYSKSKKQNSKTHILDAKYISAVVITILQNNQLIIDWSKNRCNFFLML